MRTTLTAAISETRQCLVNVGTQFSRSLSKALRRIEPEWRCNGALGTAVYRVYLCLRTFFSWVHQWVYRLLSGPSRLEVYGGSIVLLFVLYTL